MIKTSRQLKALIRNMSRSDSNKAQILIRNYGMERFLERVSLSRYKDNFILKGGMLVSSIVGLDHRATMDASPKTMVSVCGVDEKLFYQYYQDNIGTVICFLEKASELNITAEIDCASIPTCALLDNQLRQLLLLSPNIFRQRVCRPSIDVLPDLSVVRCFSMAQSKRYSLLDFDSERKIFKQFIYDIDLMQNEKCVKACKDCPIYKKYHRRCGCLTFSSFGGSDL